MQQQQQLLLCACAVAKAAARRRYRLRQCSSSGSLYSVPALQLSPNEGSSTTAISASAMQQQRRFYSALALRRRQQHDGDTDLATRNMRLPAAFDGIRYAAAVSFAPAVRSFCLRASHTTAYVIASVALSASTTAPAICVPLHQLQLQHLACAFVAASALRNITTLATLATLATS
jgi:hypothetical protein